MSDHKPNFADYVHRQGGHVSNIFESYFYLEGISGKLGIHKFALINKNKSDVKLQPHSPDITAKEIIKNIIKVFSYFTLIVPVVMLIGKGILRQKHHYRIDLESAGQKVQEQISKVEKIRHVWKKAEIPTTVRVNNKIILKTQEAPGEFLAPKEKIKRETKDSLIDALGTINSVKNRIEKTGLIGLARGRTENHDIETLYFEVDGIKFEKKHFKKYGMTTWKYEQEGQKFEVNEFEPNAYNGAKTEDFIERQSVLMNAAKKYVAELPLRDESNKEAAQSKIGALLNEIDKRFLEEIRKPDYFIDPEIMKDPARCEAHYLKIHAKVEKLLGQSARDIQFVIHDTSRTFEPNCKKFNLHALRQQEKEYIIARGRPIIINTYFLNDKENRQKQFFNMQKPASLINERGEWSPRDVIPSTVRDREGLVNYVISSFGTINSETMEPTVLFEGGRHTSYPPVFIKNSYSRQCIACQNCKQNLIDITAAIVRSQPEMKTDQDNPLVIPLRAMMLLTPKKLDSARNKKKGEWIGDSETFQMKESALALKMYHDRIFPIIINGEKIWIKPDISFMNLGINKYALTKRFDTKSLISYNAKGFIEFERDTLEYLEKFSKESPNLKKFLEEIFFYGNDSGLKKVYKELELIENIEKDKLKKLYINLDFLMEKYLDVSTTNKKELESLMNKTKDQIKKSEKVIYKKYVEILTIESKLFFKNRENIQELFQEFRRTLSENKEINVEKIEHLTGLMNKLEQAITIFHTESYRKVDSVMDFPVLYLNMHEAMSKFIEFFCKSAKDRTGRLDDKIQENLAFEDMTGHSPFKQEDKHYVDTQIAPLVHQYSASQDNAEQNLGVPGSKIDAQINPGSAKVEGKHAYLAKTIFKRAKTLEPSPWIMQMAMR